MQIFAAHTRLTQSHDSLQAFPAAHFGHMLPPPSR